MFGQALLWNPSPVPLFPSPPFGPSHLTCAGLSAGADILCVLSGTEMLSSCLRPHLPRVRILLIKEGPWNNIHERGGDDHSPWAPLALEWPSMVVPRRAQVAGPFCPITVTRGMGAAHRRGGGELLELDRASRARVWASSGNGRSWQHHQCFPHPPSPGPGHRGSHPASPARTPSLPSLPALLLHHHSSLMGLFQKGRQGEGIPLLLNYTRILFS